MTPRVEARRGLDRRLCAAILLSVGGLLAAPLAQATTNIAIGFDLQYPTSASDTNADCALCHTTVNGGGLNPYGLAIQANINLGYPGWLIAVEPLDSDNDPGGYTNIQEIDASAQPGWTGTAPAGVTGLLDPVEPGNIPPVANDDSASTAVNTPVTIDVLANDTDPDGPDALTVSGIFAGTDTNGTVVNNTTDVTYTPNADFCGTATFEYTAFDGLDDSNRATVTVAVGDANAPTITGPVPIDLQIESDVTVTVDDPVIVSWLASATATDAEDGTVEVTNNAPAEFPVGTTTEVLFTATDSCGNTAQVVGTVTVVPEPTGGIPLVTPPEPLTYTAFFCATSVPSSDEFIQLWLASATAVDAEDGVLPVSNDAPADFPAAPDPGVTTTVTFTATDSDGNVGTATSDLTIVDLNSAPVVTAPDPLTVTDPTDPAIADWLASATATDLEDGTLSVDNDAPAVFPVGTTTVTFSATDSCGVTSTATSTVTVTGGALVVDVFVRRNVDLQDPILNVYFSRDDMDILPSTDTSCTYKDNPPVFADSGRRGDFDGDGFIDTLGRFPSAEFGFECTPPGENARTLSCEGTLVDGTPFVGTSNTFFIVNRGCE